MGMALAGSRGLKAEINVTPMIDVLLVLLTIFMVLAPLTPAGLYALVPQPPPPDRGDTIGHAEIVVSVARNGAILINHENVRLADLGQRLRHIFKFRAEGVIFVRGDKNLEYREVAQVIDIARGAGVSRVALMTNP